MKIKHHEPVRVKTELGRLYLTPDGRRYPGVTTILDITKPEAAKTALAAWAERENNRSPGGADRITKFACDRGTWVHNSVDHWYLHQAPPEYHYAFQPWFNSLLPVLDSLGERFAAEQAVYHRYYAYAGTYDMITRTDDGEFHLIDWKTSVRPKSAERLYDYSLQLAAYTYAIEDTYAEAGIYIDSAKLVVALPDEKPQIVTYTRDDLEDRFDDFRKRLSEYQKWSIIKHNQLLRDTAP